MHQLACLAAFWLLVVVTIRLAVCFPRSLLARVLFSRHGIERARGESRTAHLVRSARFHIGWFAQAAAMSATGWLLVDGYPVLYDSLPFVVFWAVVVPILGAGELFAAIAILVRFALIRRTNRADVAATNVRNG